jgi:hypothetical protein
MAMRQQALRQIGDGVVVFGMDHDEGAFVPRHRQHVQDLPVVQLQQIVGHIELEGGITVAHQRRQLLPHHLLGRVRDDQVEAVIDAGLRCGQLVIVLHHLAQRHALMLGRERQDEGGAAAGGRARGGEPVVRRVLPVGGALIGVDMGIHPARQHQLAPGVDLLFPGPQLLAKGHDHAVAHADVGLEQIAGGGDVAPADH